MAAQCPLTGRKKYLVARDVPCVLLLRQSDVNLLRSWRVNVLRFYEELFGGYDYNEDLFGYRFSRLKLPLASTPLNELSLNDLRVSILETDGRQGPLIQNKDICVIPDDQFDSLIRSRPTPARGQLESTYVPVKEISDLKQLDVSECPIVLLPGETVPKSLILPAIACHGTAISNAVLVQVTFLREAVKGLCRVQNPKDYELLLQREGLKPLPLEAATPLPTVKWTTERAGPLTPKEMDEWKARAAAKFAKQ